MRPKLRFELYGGKCYDCMIFVDWSWGRLQLICCFALHNYYFPKIEKKRQVSEIPRTGKLAIPWRKDGPPQADRKCSDNHNRSKQLMSHSKNSGLLQWLKMCTNRWKVSPDEVVHQIFGIIMEIYNGIIMDVCEVVSVSDLAVCLFDGVLLRQCWFPSMSRQHCTSCGPSGQTCTVSHRPGPGSSESYHNDATMMHHASTSALLDGSNVHNSPRIAGVETEDLLWRIVVSDLLLDQP